MPSTANGEVDAALRFHAATKYSAVRLPSGEPDCVMGTAPDFEPPTWEEDWSILPSAFKPYTSLPPLALPAGVYHYATQDHALRQLRAGDLRGVLVAASEGEPSLAQAPVVLVMTSTFWRNAFRYKARAYRHTFWDVGTSLANVLSAAASLHLPTRVVLGYADEGVNALLGIDGQREAAVALCSLGHGVRAPEPPLHLDPIEHATQPLS